MKLEKIFTDQIDEIGDQHLSSSRVTPMRPDAFDLSNSEKILLIEEKMREILYVLGMDLTDDSLSGTPTSLKLPPLKTNISTEKCWSKKISPSTPLVNIICYL